MPMVALNFFALALASADCMMMPLGKNISLPKSENIPATCGLTWRIISFSSRASGFMVLRLHGFKSGLFQIYREYTIMYAAACHAAKNHFAIF